MQDEMQNKAICDLIAEHTQEILIIQRNRDIEVHHLKNEMTAVTLLANNRENRNHDLQETLKNNQYFREEMAKMKDYYFLR